MKRIEDLKENECIEIRNKKEAKAIQKLCGVNFELTTNHKYPFFYYPSTYTGIDCKIRFNDLIYDVSQFISKKKSLKKRVKELEKKVEALEAYNKYRYKISYSTIDLTNQEIKDNLRSNLSGRKY